MLFFNRFFPRYFISYKFCVPYVFTLPYPDFTQRISSTFPCYLCNPQNWTLLRRLCADSTPRSTQVFRKSSESLTKVLRNIMRRACGDSAQFWLFLCSACVGITRSPTR